MEARADAIDTPTARVGMCNKTKVTPDTGATHPLILVIISKKSDDE
jgi:hypothetical protein